MNGSATPSQQAGGHVERFNRERVAELFTLGRSTYVVTPLNGALLALMLWGAGVSGVVILWLIALLLVMAGRVALHVAYRRSLTRDSDPLAWERRFALGAFAAGAVWALAPALFFEAGDSLQRVALMFVLGGMIVGAAGVYASSPLAFRGFVILPVLASMGVLLAQGMQGYVWMAAMTLVFGFAMARVFGQLNRSVSRTLLTRLENEALVERLGTSDARFRDAIENAPDGIAIYDQDDRLVACNLQYASLYAPGKRPEELAGTPFHTIAQNALEQAESVSVDPADREAWLASRIERHRQGRGELRQYRTRDGRWLQGKTMPTPLGGIVAVFTDISELKRAEAAYQAVLEEENLVLDILPVGVVFVQERVIVRCNRRFEAMLGYAHGELAGKSTKVLFGSERAWKAIGTGTYSPLAGGGVIEDDTRMVRKDGTEIWCRSLGRALDASNPQKAAIFAFSDARDRRAAELALRSSEEMYRGLVETSNDLIWSIDAQGRWAYLNAAAVRRIWGADVAELLGRPFSDTLAQGVRERDIAVFNRVLEGEPIQDYETRHLRQDGVVVDLSFNAIPVRTPDGEVIGATGTARDITQARQAAAALYESVERLRLAVDAADLYHWEWSGATDSFAWGRDPAGLLGVPPSGEGMERDFRVLIHAEDRDRYDESFHRALATGATHACEFRIIGNDGQARWVAVRGNVVRGADGRATRVLGVSQDVTERKRQEEEVRYLAYHDTLTSLPNRRLLDDRLRQAVFAAQRRDTRLAVLLIDLDHFKVVNDSLGHRAGDAVLREVANRLGSCVRKADTLARQGGDEFVIMIPDLSMETDCSVVAEKILRTLEPQIQVEGGSFTIGASIGISLFPADAGSAEALLRNADAAMYRAKEIGRNNYCFYGR